MRPVFPQELTLPSIVPVNQQEAEVTGRGDMAIFAASDQPGHALLI